MPVNAIEWFAAPPDELLLRVEEITRDYAREIPVRDKMKVSFETKTSWRAFGLSVNVMVRARESGSDLIFTTCITKGFDSGYGDRLAAEVLKRLMQMSGRSEG